MGLGVRRLFQGPDKVRATGGKGNLPSGDLGRLKEEGSGSTEDEKEDPPANS